MPTASSSASSSDWGIWPGGAEVAALARGRPSLRTKPQAAQSAARAVVAPVAAPVAVAQKSARSGTQMKLLISSGGSTRWGHPTQCAWRKRQPLRRAASRPPTCPGPRSRRDDSGARSRRAPRGRGSGHNLPCRSSLSSTSTGNEQIARRVPQGAEVAALTRGRPSLRTKPQAAQSAARAVAAPVAAQSLRLGSRAGRQAPAGPAKLKRRGTRSSDLAAFQVRRQGRWIRFSAG